MPLIDFLRTIDQNRNYISLEVLIQKAENYYRSCVKPQTLNLLGFHFSIGENIEGYFGEKKKYPSGYFCLSYLEQDFEHLDSNFFYILARYKLTVRGAFSKL